MNANLPKAWMQQHKELFDMRFSRFCRIHANENCSIQAHGTIPGVLKPLALTLGLLIMFGCGGGYEGFTHVAPSITVEPVAQSEALGVDCNLHGGEHGDGPSFFPVVQRRSCH